MKFRAKLTIAMVLLLSLTYGIGGSLMIAQSFSSSIDRERDAAVQTYRMVVDVLDLLGDNASPGTAANTVALVLHKLGSGGSSTAARIRFGAQMTTTGDTALLDEAPEPPAGSGVTSIVHTGNGRHYLMLGASGRRHDRPARVRRDGDLYRAPDAAARLPHDVSDPRRLRRGRGMGHILPADAPARHAFTRVKRAGARQPRLSGARALARRGGAARRRLQPHGRAA